MDSGRNQAGNLKVLALLAGAALLVLLYAPLTGQIDVPLSALWKPDAGLEGEILWKIRLPRVALSFLAGAALAASGMVFQAVFRNVLADPFTLGIASGAAFGAALAGALGVGTASFWLGGSVLFSFLGAAATMFIVVLLASSSQGFAASSMLLAGVIVGFFFSSLILLLQYLGDFSQVYRLSRWLMGSLDVAGFEILYTVAPLIIMGLAMIWLMARRLDLLVLGDELAVSRGLNATKARFLFFLVTSLMVGCVVSVCGPIGFVGLIVPYVCRALAGANHRLVHLYATLLGGSFLTLCDTVARTIIAPSEIPVGIVTAVLGGPFFLWILHRNRALHL